MSKITWDERGVRHVDGAPDPDDAGVKGHDDLADRCKASAAKLTTMSLQQGPQASDLAEAAMLLRLVWLMLVDDEPLTDWGEVDGELMMIISKYAGGAPRGLHDELRTLLRKVSGE